jgi:hypothetical protein
MNNDVKLLFEATSLVTLIMSISRLAPLGSDETYQGTPVWTHLDSLSSSDGSEALILCLCGEAAISCHGLSRGLHLGLIKLTIKNKKRDWFPEVAGEGAEES